jgi:hypothetical protein
MDTKTKEVVAKVYAFGVAKKAPVGQWGKVFDQAYEEKLKELQTKSEEHDINRNYWENAMEATQKEVIPPKCVRNGLVKEKFKTFNLDLFKAYINKFSQENKAEMLQVLIDDLGVRALVDKSLRS